MQRKLNPDASWTPKADLRKTGSDVKEQLQALLEQVPEDDYLFLADNRGGWQYVNDLMLPGKPPTFAAKIHGKAWSQRWPDPRLCAAELYLVAHPDTVLGMRYRAFAENLQENPLVTKIASKPAAKPPRSAPRDVVAVDPTLTLTNDEVARLADERVLRSLRDSLALEEKAVATGPYDPGRLKRINDLRVEIKQFAQFMEREMGVKPPPPQLALVPLAPPPLAGVVDDDTIPPVGAGIVDDDTVPVVMIVGTGSAPTVEAVEQLRVQRKPRHAASPDPEPTTSHPIEELIRGLHAAGRKRPDPSLRWRGSEEAWRLHRYATDKARTAYRDLLSGSREFTSSATKSLRISVDYAICSGLLTYWFWWVSIRSGTFENPVFDRKDLDNPACATETRKLLDNGIPSDFLFDPTSHTPLYATNNPNRLPETGFPITIEEAAFLVMLRPPSWVVPEWQPPDQGPYGDEANPGPDLFMGYDPVASKLTGSVQPLPIPPYLSDRSYPVLTVPEAFMTWALTCAAVMQAADLSTVPFLSKEAAAARVFSYTDKDRVFGVRSPLEAWKATRLNWDIRVRAGEPMSEVIADLGPPPPPPSLQDIDWESHRRQLQDTTGHKLPLLAQWTTLPTVIHDDPLVEDRPLHLLEEISSSSVLESAPAELPSDSSDFVAFAEGLPPLPTSVMATATPPITGPGPCPSCGEEMDPVDGCRICDPAAQAAAAWNPNQEPWS